jgi:hypothetical protein
VRRASAASSGGQYPNGATSASWHAADTTRSKLADPDAYSTGEAADVCDEAATLETLGVVSIVVSAVLGVTGTSLLIVKSRRAREPSRVAVVPQVGATSGKIELVYRF